MRFFTLSVLLLVVVNPLRAELLYQPFTWGYSSIPQMPTEYTNPTWDTLVAPMGRTEINLTGDDSIYPFMLPPGGPGLYSGIFERARVDITVQAFGANPEIDQASYTFSAWYNANRALNNNSPFFTTDPQGNAFAPTEFTLLDRRFRIILPEVFEDWSLPGRLDVTVTPANMDSPEPTTGVLALLGLAGAGIARWRQRRRVASAHAVTV